VAILGVAGCGGGDYGSLSGKGDGAPDDAAVGASPDVALASDAAGSSSDGSDASEASEPSDAAEASDAFAASDAPSSDAYEAGVPDASSSLDAAGEGAPDSGPPAVPEASTDASTDADPCAAIDCAPQTPADTCSGLTWTHYAPDTCAAGACVLHPSTTDCSGSAPCVAYACGPASGCSSARMRDGTLCTGVANGFCLGGACTTRALTVSVSPGTAALHAPGQVSLSATVTSNDPSDATSVTWAMAPNTAGSLSSTPTSAVYTTPAILASEGTLFVTATSTADPTQNATATITVAPPLALSFPLGPVQGTHLSQPFELYVRTSNLLPAESGVVTLSVDLGSFGPVSCIPRSSNDGGSVDCAALYTPSEVSPPYAHVTATSADNPAVTAAMDIGVVADIAVTMAKQVPVLQSQEIQVSATLSNLSSIDKGAGTFSLGTTAPQGYPAGALVGSAPSCSAPAMGSSTCTQTYRAPGIPPLPLNDVPVNVAITFTSTDESSVTAKGFISVVP
jgi:hypothetical protein